MKNLKIPQIHFKKIGIILITIIAFFICNNASALIVEIDPLTPLTDYISMAEWNTDGDFENWAYNAHIIDTQVSGGDFIGKDDGVDPVMSLDIDALTPPDARMELATTIGTVFEVRMQLVTNTLNPRIDFWATINGSGPGSFPPMQFAAAGGAIPEVPTDGQFHVFRITLEAGDNYIGNLNALRLDPVADALPIGETFKIDYFRVANVTNRIVIVQVDSDPIFNYTSLGEWNTDGDFEDWQMNNIGSSNVTEGAMSGSPANGDPYFYKSDAQSLPAPVLSKAPFLEFRIKQTASFTSEMEIFFGTSDNPGMSGSRHAAIPAALVPADGKFHIYRYNMSTHADWNSDLQLIRIDPYVNDGSIGKQFEIDYIRVGSKETPTIDPTATQGDYPDKIAVSWDNVEIVNKYQVWRNTTNDSSTASINSPELTTNFYEDTSATVEVDYYYWVKAFITNDWGDFGSSAMGFATASTGPDKPTNISPAADAAVASFPVVLQASAYNDQYNWPMEAVEWQLNNNTNFSYVKWDSGILLTNLTSVEPPSPKISLTNYWRVRYKNKRDKWSEWSDKTMFTFTGTRSTNSSFYFYDTFNTTGSGDVNNGFYRAGRQFGTIIPLNYTMIGKSKVGSECANPGELLLGLSSGVTPNYSFADFGNFKIEFDVVPHALDKTNDWIALTFGKSNAQNAMKPVSSSGASLGFFGNGAFMAFDGETLVGSGTGVPTDEKLHIILTASTEGFDHDSVKYSAFVNGIPMITVTSPNLGYVYNNVGGFDNNFISLFNNSSISTNISLFDNLKITKVENSISVTNWLNDSDMLPMDPAKTTHAVNINGESVTINGVDFIGTGTNFGGHVNGSAILQSNGWELMSANGTVLFHGGENVTNLVTDTGTKTLMEYFGYFNAPGGTAALKLSGLTPYSSNVISIYSYGWENANREVYFSSTSGGTITNVNQDTYGIGTGIIVRYGYVADNNGKATIVISTSGSAGWHLSGFYSEEIFAPEAQISVADKVDFGEVAVGIPATFPLEIVNMGAGVVSGSINGISAPFSLANSYYATAATSDAINVTFNPSSDGDFSQTITLSGSGGNAQVVLTGTGVPEPCLFIICYLSFVIYYFKMRK
ncbi:MAG: hypothetical protein DRI44_01750 [Chlamydiae bacterium]|nr:MAG: hypothetical protein DRI44_01750 [Chlamydiota bacterium]